MDRALLSSGELYEEASDREINRETSRVSGHQIASIPAYPEDV